MCKFHKVVIVLGAFAILFGASALTAQTDFSVKIYAEDGSGWTDSVTIGKYTTATDADRGQPQPGSRRERASAPSAERPQPGAGSSHCGSDRSLRSAALRTGRRCRHSSPGQRRSEGRLPRQVPPHGPRRNGDHTLLALRPGSGERRRFLPDRRLRRVPVLTGGHGRADLLHPRHRSIGPSRAASWTSWSATGR